MEFFVDCVEVVREVDGKKAAPLAFLGSTTGNLYALGGHGGYYPLFQEFFGTLVSITVSEGESGDEKVCFIGRLEERWETQPIISHLRSLPSFSRYLDLEYVEAAPLSEMLWRLSEKVSLAQASISLGTEDVLKSLEAHLSPELGNSFARLLVLWRSGVTRKQVETCTPGFFERFPELESSLVAELAELDPELDEAKEQRSLLAWLRSEPYKS